MVSVPASSPARGPRNPVARGWERLERRLDPVFGPASNPLRHLGALGYTLFWVVAATGAYLYAVFDTSVSGAYQSTVALSSELLGVGAFLRALHRYASDALLVIMGLHMLRELAFGRVGGFRRFTWLTGIPLLWLLPAAGIVGFWLVWDQTAAVSAIATMEWVDTLGQFGDPLARNFQTASQINDRLFSLFVFLHIGLPLLVLAVMWIHVQRLARPETRTSRPLTIGVLGALCLLSLAQPAPIADAADVSRLPATLAIDWFYLAPNALSDQGHATVLWSVAGGGTLALVALPWILRSRRAPVAVVDPVHCNGCSRCFEDCPYGAISMIPQPGGSLAVVNAAACASCGICAGSCPSATPFRSVDVLVSGIDLPQDPVDRIRRDVNASLVAQPGATVVLACAHAVDTRRLAAAGFAVAPLECAGQVPPSFVEFALRHGARGVAVVACAQGGCEFRLGDRWTVERLTAEREPHLRASVPRDRITVVRAIPGEEKRVADDIRKALPEETLHV